MKEKPKAPLPFWGMIVLFIPFTLIGFYDMLTSTRFYAAKYEMTLLDTKKLSRVESVKFLMDVDRKGNLTTFRISKMDPKTREVGEEVQFCGYEDRDVYFGRMLGTGVRILHKEGGQVTWERDSKCANLKLMFDSAKKGYAFFGDGKAYRLNRIGNDNFIYELYQRDRFHTDRANSKIKIVDEEGWSNTLFGKLQMKHLP